MTNPMRGEASFELEGERYTLTFSFNELVALEDEMGVKVEDLAATLSEKARTIRTVFRICLEAKHGAMTDQEAGNLISAIGPAAAAEVVGKALAAAFPQEATPDPRKPASASAKKRTRNPGIGTGA